MPKTDDMVSVGSADDAEADFGLDVTPAAAVPGVVAAHQLEQTPLSTLALDCMAQIVAAADAAGGLSASQLPAAPVMTPGAAAEAVQQAEQAPAASPARPLAPPPTPLPPSSAEQAAAIAQALAAEALAEMPSAAELADLEHCDLVEQALQLAERREHLELALEALEEEAASLRKDGAQAHEAIELTLGGLRKLSISAGNLTEPTAMDAVACAQRLWERLRSPLSGAAGSELAAQEPLLKPIIERGQEIQQRVTQRLTDLAAPWREASPKEKVEAPEVAGAGESVRRSLAEGFANISERVGQAAGGLAASPKQAEALRSFAEGFSHFSERLGKAAEALAGSPKAEEVGEQKQEGAAPTEQQRWPRVAGALGALSPAGGGAFQTVARRLQFEPPARTGQEQGSSPAAATAAAVETGKGEAATALWGSLQDYWARSWKTDESDKSAQKRRRRKKRAQETSEEDAFARVVIDACVRMQDGTVASCRLRTSDTRKDAVARFAREHNLDATSCASLRALLKRAAAEADKFPTRVEVDWADLCQELPTN